MKSNYNGFRGWLNYVRDYKDNKDFTSENLREKELNDKIEKQKNEYNELSNLLALRNKTIDILNQEVTKQKKRNDELRKTLNMTMKENEILKEELGTKEIARRRNAGAIGGYKAKINELKLDLEKANHKINFLENSKHAPSKDEIRAYETCMKEVYKKIQEKNKKDID